MARLLSAAGVCREYGIGKDRFRAIRQAGEGPAEFDPLGSGKALFVDTVVEAWLAARDDRPEGKVS